MLTQLTNSYQATNLISQHARFVCGKKTIRLETHYGG